MASSELLLTNGPTPGTNPASGKTKLFVNASKELSQVDDAGLVTIFGGVDSVSQATPADPTGTTNTTGLMMGLAGAITPVYTGRILVTICGSVANSTIADGAKWQIRYGTGAAPANAAALTGTTAGPLQTMSDGVAAQKMPFSVTAVITGLTLATAVWLDLSLAAVTGGTASLVNVGISAVEV